MRVIYHTRCHTSRDMCPDGERDRERDPKQTAIPLFYKDCFSFLNKLVTPHQKRSGLEEKRSLFFPLQAQYR